MYMPSKLSFALGGELDGNVLFFLLKTSPEKRTNTTLGLHPLLCFVNICPVYDFVLSVALCFHLCTLSCAISDGVIPQAGEKKNASDSPRLRVFLFLYFFFKRTINRCSKCVCDGTRHPFSPPRRQNTDTVQRAVMIKYARRQCYASEKKNACQGLYNRVECSTPKSNT